MVRLGHVLFVATAAVPLLVPGSLRAQTPEFRLPPSSLLPNYGRVGIGQREAIEAGAYVARTDDALANWYNPAGLALSRKTALNASSSAYELTSTTLSGIGQESSSTQLTPTGGFFGIVVGEPIAKRTRWRFGAAFTKPVSWSPGTLDGEFNLPAMGGTEAFSYSTTASFGTVIPSLNGAYQLSPTLRVGVGVGYGMTDLAQDQTVGDRLVLPDGVVTALRSYVTDGGVQHLLFTLGAQWDVAPAFTVGALVTAAGVRMGGKSKVTLSESVFDVAQGQSDLTFRDPEARFDFKLPVRAAVGATWRYARGQVELDVRYYGAEDAYELFSSDSLATRITTDSTGVPVISHPTFTPVLNQARSIVSFALGANLALSRAVRVHGGAFIDPSPVDQPSQSIFRAVNLTGVSGGVSLGSGNLTASLGVSSSWGTTTEQQVGPSLGGQSGTTDVSIQTFTGLYSISFTF